MSTSPLREWNDRALWPVIDACDERCREKAIEELITGVVKPVVGTILSRFRRVEPSLRIEDVEEIASQVALRLIRKVRAAAVYEEHAIADFENYVATITYNAMYDFRRRRYPERHRLKRNLRYVLTRERMFALWETPELAVAGLAHWDPHSLRTQKTALTPSSATAVMGNKERPVEALHAILERIGHPIAFETLVDVVASLWNVRDVVVESGEFPPDQQLDQLASLEQRQYLDALWSEICGLQDNQRTALLFNLRDPGGSNALMLFLLLNIADAAEIARVTGVTENELNELWEFLPMDDLSIASRLGLTRQQVINLRKAARARLARRMAKWK